MKNLVAAILASIPGMLAGLALWNVLAICILVVYWVGYVVLYLGILCGRGKFGFGLCTPPDPAVQQFVHEWSFFFTVFAFTWGEVFAVAIGALFGSVAGVAVVRLFSLAKRVVRRRRSEPGNQTQTGEPGTVPIAEPGKKNPD